MRGRHEGPPKKLSDLFEVYRKRLRAPQGSVVDAAIEVIHDVIGVTLKKSEVTYTPRTRTLTLRTSGMVKSEVHLKKEEILAHLKGRLGPSNAPESIL
jgi:hypothetical protein